MWDRCNFSQFFSLWPMPLRLNKFSQSKKVNWKLKVKFSAGPGSRFCRGNAFEWRLTSVLPSLLLDWRMILCIFRSESNSASKKFQTTYFRGWYAMLGAEPLIWRTLQVQHPQQWQGREICSRLYSGRWIRCLHQQDSGRREEELRSPCISKKPARVSDCKRLVRESNELREFWTTAEGRECLIWLKEAWELSLQCTECHKFWLPTFTLWLQAWHGEDKALVYHRSCRIGSEYSLLSDVDWLLFTSFKEYFHLPLAPK